MERDGDEKRWREMGMRRDGGNGKRRGREKIKGYL